MYSRWVPFVWPLTCAVTTACADTQPDADAEHQDPAALSRLELQEDTRIGPPAASPEALADMSSVAVCPSGAIGVVEATLNRVLLYDEGGNFVASVGRKGRGPGEFEWPQLIGCRGDTLSVADVGSQRVTLIAADGRIRGTISLATAASVSVSGSPRGYGPGGAVIVVPTVNVNGPPPQDPAPFPIMVLKPGPTEGLDTIRVIHRRTGARYVPLPKGGIVLSDPYPQEPVVEVSPRGDLVVIVDRKAAAHAIDTATFGIEVMAADGKSIASRRIRYAPRAVGPAERDSVHDAIARRFVPGLFPSLDAARRAVEEGVPTPAFWPPIKAVVVGADTTIWLQRSELEWLVLDGSANPVATVRAPTGTRLVAGARERAWGVTLSDDDLPTLHRFVARPIPPGSATPDKDNPPPNHR